MAAHRTRSSQSIQCPDPVQVHLHLSVLKPRLSSDGLNMVNIRTELTNQGNDTRTDLEIAAHSLSKSRVEGGIQKDGVIQTERHHAG